jgi:hypothetical protein
MKTWAPKSEFPAIFGWSETLGAFKSKSIHKAPPRLQQMLFRLQKYNLDLKYTPGKLMYVADTLSLVFVNENDTEQELN